MVLIATEKNLDDLVIEKDGITMLVHETHEASLDKLLGTPDWRNDFIETKPQP